MLLKNILGEPWAQLPILPRGLRTQLPDGLVALMILCPAMLIDKKNICFLLGGGIPWTQR
jgi:hypothetical protein